jgi:RNA polymerase sigma-70 factor (ECF subfamily)
MNSDSNTSESLLFRLQQPVHDQESWEAFVRRYGSRIYNWCLNRRLQPHDAEDVTQNVLVRLARKIQSFEYDPAKTFRGWLRRVTENAINDFFQERKRLRGQSVSELSELADNLEARSDLMQQLESAFDLELLEKAVDLVRKRISANRFLAWELSTQNNEPIANIAAQLNMKIATVYTAKSQVQALIRAEVERLENLHNSRQLELSHTAANRLPAEISATEVSNRDPKFAKKYLE